MKQHMQYIIDHADEIDKLIKVKAQVSEVKSIMLENIDKVCSSATRSASCGYLEILYFLISYSLIVYSNFCLTFSLPSTLSHIFLLTKEYS